MRCKKCGVEIKPLILNGEKFSGFVDGRCVCGKRFGYLADSISDSVDGDVKFEGGKLV